MVIKNRGETIGQGQVVQLRSLFKVNGVPTDLNDFPSVQLIEPSTSLYMNYTTAGVYKIDTGIYGFNFEVPVNAQQGTWQDNWQGAMGLSNELVSASFSFTVLNITIPSALIEDGYEQLGDEPVVVLTQAAIHNINQLVHILRRRLQSSGWHLSTDSFGNQTRENCDIFSIDELFSFLCSSLSEFNSTPHFTGFSWENEVVIEFKDIIIEGAYIMSVSSKGLIEKGREFTVTDNGLSFQPPAVADFLNSQMSSMLSPYREKLKYIKANFKPSPLGLGTIRIAAVSPQIMRLRHRRQMQFPIQ
ncbi:MAG: hypothetical protein ACOYMA_00575 [Bacteroidia bacterium]